MNILSPLKCTECGGKVDRETMTCNFCGIQFKIDETKPNSLDCVSIKVFYGDDQVLEKVFNSDYDIFRR